MLNMLIAESLLCQLVSGPFVTTNCSWQQWAPTFVGFIAALILRVSGIGRLVTFIGGVASFYLITFISEVVAPLQTNQEPLGWFLFACLFLVPVAFAVALGGLVCGDLCRYLQKRYREARV